MYFNNRVQLSLDRNSIPINADNIIPFNDKTYYVLPLNSKYSSSKGGNSSVYKLVDEFGSEYAIKFSNYPRPRNKNEINIGYSRFLNEISALKEANDNDFSNVIKLISDGVIEFDRKEYPYIIMEKADTDLKEYLLSKQEIDIQQKFLLCRDIFTAIKGLHSIEIYHRDIKPDNILLFISDDKFTWKIADLGLIKYREIDIDVTGEKIGPLGWFSPEATNKFLTEKFNIGHDCTIDHCSDIFMLGELFWFVFKLNIPIGQVNMKDFDIDFPENVTYFDLVKSMLSHSKVNRVSISDIEFFLDTIGKELKI